MNEYTLTEIIQQLEAVYDNLDRMIDDGGRSDLESEATRLDQIITDLKEKDE